MSLEHAKRIAEAILQAQLIGRTIQPVIPKPFQFEEAPRPLSYYYQPHQHKSVEANTSEMIFEFTVPPGHLLHLHQIANNWYVDSYAHFEIDGARIETVERVISHINTPLDISHRYIVANNRVTWKTFNNSSEAIESHCLIDGVIYLVSDWKRKVGLK